MSAPATTVANPEWFRACNVNRPRIERARLHRQLLDDARAAAPGAAGDRHAVIVNGPDVTDRNSVVEDVLGAAATRHLHIDVKVFTAGLLGADDAKEDAVEGVLGEAYALAERLRDAALRDGVNLIIDTDFMGAEQAVALGRQIADAGYTIDVVDIQPSGPSEVEVRSASQLLAVGVDAVTAYRRYSPAPPDGRLRLDTDLARATIGGPLVDAAAARARATARAGTPGTAPRRDPSSGRGD